MTGDWAARFRRTNRQARHGHRPMIRYRYATPRPGEDVLTRVPRRTTVPYRMAHPAPVRMAHEVRPLPAKRSRVAPDLLALAVILAVVLAASLAGVRL